MGAVLELLDVVYIIEDDDRRDRTQQFRAKQYDLAFRNRGKRIILLGIAFDKVSLTSPTERLSRSDVAISPQFPYFPTYFSENFQRVTVVGYVVHAKTTLGCTAQTGVPWRILYLAS